jgi:hypothetical protein
MNQLLLSVLLCLSTLAYGQSNGTDSLKNLKTDPISNRLYFSGKLNTNAKMEVILGKVQQDIAQGKPAETIAKKNPYVYIKLLPLKLPDSIKDVRIYFIVLGKQSPKSKKSTAPDGEPFAFWHNEPGLPDNELVSVLILSAKDNVFKYRIQEIKYFPMDKVLGSVFTAVSGLILSNPDTYTHAGYNIDDLNLSQKFARQKEHDPKLKITKEQLEIDAKWNTIRPISIKAYDVFAGIWDEYMKALFQ